MLTPAWQGQGPKVELAPWGRPGSTVAAKPPLSRLSATFSVPSPKHIIFNLQKKQRQKKF